MIAMTSIDDTTAEPQGISQFDEASASSEPIREDLLTGTRIGEWNPRWTLHSTGCSSASELTGGSSARCTKTNAKPMDKESERSLVSDDCKPSTILIIEARNRFADGR